MKKILVVSLIAFASVYAQVSGTIITQKFSGEDLSFRRGCTRINDDEIVADHFITDLEGNVKGTTPSYLNPGFSYSKNGIYSLYMFSYSFIDYGSVNSVKNLKEGKKSEVDLTTTSKYTMGEECFSSASSTGFLTEESGQSEYGVLPNRHTIYIADNEKLLHTVEIKVSSKILDQMHTANGYYYALCGGEGKLTLARIELSTGNDEYLELDKKYSYYNGAKMKFTENKLIVSVFGGECKNVVTMNGTYARTKMEKLVNIIVDPSEMKLMASDHIEIPGDYNTQVTIDANKDENSYLAVIDILPVGEDIYILSDTRQGPYAIWKYSGGKTSFVHSIQTVDEKYYIRSARLFNYSGTNYLIYYEEKGSMINQKPLILAPKMATFDSNELSPISVDISGLGKIRGDLELQYSYLTSAGVIIIPAVFSEAYTGYLMTIKL